MTESLTTEELEAYHHLDWISLSMKDRLLATIDARDKQIEALGKENAELKKDIAFIKQCAQIS